MSGKHVHRKLNINRREPFISYFRYAKLTLFIYNEFHNFRISIRKMFSCKHLLSYKIERYWIYFEID